MWCLFSSSSSTTKSPYTGVFDASILMYEESGNLDDLESLNDGGDVKRPLTGTGDSGNKASNSRDKKTGPTRAGVNNAADATTRGGMSTTYNNQQIGEDSLSTLSDKKKKVIVRIVTVFSVIFFLICFAMIAFTLRMSEKIDAQSKLLVRASGDLNVR